MAFKNGIPEDEVKAIFATNRRQVKNRGSARRSRVNKNDRLEMCKDECRSKRNHLERLKWFTAAIHKLRKKKSVRSIL